MRLVLSEKIGNDSTLSHVIRAPVLGWLRNQRGFPIRPDHQLAEARTRVLAFLRQHEVINSDVVVFIGHSYGGNIAYELADSLADDLRRRGISTALITFEPIDWKLCGFTPPAVNCNQANDPKETPSNVPGANIRNFVHRNPNQGPVFFLPFTEPYGYDIIGAINDAFLGRGPDHVWGTPDDTLHELIDYDLSPGSDGQVGTDDDADLGIYAEILNFLRALRVVGTVSATSAVAAGPTGGERSLKIATMIAVNAHPMSLSLLLHREGDVRPKPGRVTDSADSFAGYRVMVDDAFSSTATTAHPSQVVESARLVDTGTALNALAEVTEGPAWLLGELDPLLDILAREHLIASRL